VSKGQGNRLILPPFARTKLGGTAKTQKSQNFALSSRKLRLCREVMEPGDFPQNGYFSKNPAFFKKAI
jgi:hypothetical protein